MFPSIDGSEDAVWIGGPDEGLWVCIGLFDEAVDGGLELDEGMEDASFQAPSGELGEEALDGIEPGG